MFIHAGTKRINNLSEWPVEATFEYQGVQFSERYKSLKMLNAALKRNKKYSYKGCVDYQGMKVYKVSDAIV